MRIKLKKKEKKVNLLDRGKSKGFVPLNGYLNECRPLTDEYLKTLKEYMDFKASKNKAAKKTIEINKNYKDLANLMAYFEKGTKALSAADSGIKAVKEAVKEAKDISTKVKGVYSSGSQLSKEANYIQHIIEYGDKKVLEACALFYVEVYYSDIGKSYYAKAVHTARTNDFVLEIFKEKTPIKKFLRKVSLLYGKDPGGPKTISSEDLFPKTVKKRPKEDTG